MKKIISLFIFTALYLSSFSQEYSTKDRKAIQYFEKATASYRQGQLAQTEEQLKLAIARDSNFQEAQLELALFYADRKNYDQAIFFLESAIQINAEKYAVAHYYLGKFKLKKGDYNAAKMALFKYKSLEIHDLNKIADEAEKTYLQKNRFEPF